MTRDRARTAAAAGCFVASALLVVTGCSTGGSAAAGTSATSATAQGFVPATSASPNAPRTTSSEPTTGRSAKPTRSTTSSEVERSSRSTRSSDTAPPSSVRRPAGQGATSAPPRSTSSRPAATSGRTGERRSVRVVRFVPVEFQVEYRPDPQAEQGTQRVAQQGALGTQRVTILQTIVDGRVVSSRVIARDTVKAPVNHIVYVGSKPESTATPTPTSTPTTTSPSPTTSETTDPIDLRRAEMWDGIAQQCTAGNWAANDGNGFYGGLQFTSDAWLGNGGGEFASRADLAGREQQITIANRLYDQTGWTGGCSPVTSSSPEPGAPATLTQ